MTATRYVRMTTNIVIKLSYLSKSLVTPPLVLLSNRQMQRPLDHDAPIKQTFMLWNWIDYIHWIILTTDRNSVSLLSHNALLLSLLKWQDYWHFNSTQKSSIGNKILFMPSKQSLISKTDCILAKIFFLGSNFICESILQKWPKIWHFYSTQNCETRNYNSFCLTSTTTS